MPLDSVLLHGPWFGGKLPCLLCRHARRRKTRAEWQGVCGECRDLSQAEVNILYWNQEHDPDRVVVPPNLLRLSRRNSDARYALAADVLRGYGVAPGALVLDVGCGLSEQAEMFHLYRYVGADTSAPRIGYGARSHPWARYSVQSVVQLGFPGGAFDVVLCLEVVEHLEPVLRDFLTRELFRVLHRDGLLLLSTPDGIRTPWKRIFGEKCERSHISELSQKEVERLVVDAGGRVLECRPIDNFVQPAGKLSIVAAHVLSDRPRWRGRVGRWWARAGYRTLLYAATHA